MSLRGYLLHGPDGSTYIAQWWKGRGGLIDFTNPDGKKWWQGQVAKAIDAGADGFKDDDAEGNFIGDVKFASGEEVRMVRNRYAVDYNHAVAEVLTQRKRKDWVLFQRSGTTGSHTLPFFWGGDNDASSSPVNGLPTVVTAGLNGGMSGISLWMSDTGGYNKTARRVLGRVTQREVYLPEGDWIDYWSGKQISGHRTILADAPLDRIPLYVRSGAIIPKIPDDVMTLGPANEYSEKSVKSLDERRVYEIYPGSKLEAIRDFENRSIEPAPAHIGIRWRFGMPGVVMVNGRSVFVGHGASGSEIEFDHAGTTALTRG